MTATTIAYISIVVFGLMIIGLYLTAREFLRVSDDPSSVEGVDSNLKSKPDKSSNAE
jgi:hypothetical protein